MNWSAVEDILVTVGFFAAVVGIVWLRARVNQVRLARQAETQQQLLAKLEDIAFLTHFLDPVDRLLRFPPNRGLSAEVLETVRNPLAAAHLLPMRRLRRAINLLHRNNFASLLS